MRQILMTVMLIVTVVMLYAHIVDGSGGTRDSIRSSGNRMADGISRISP
jgi:hypothetical protein